MITILYTLLLFVFFLLIFPMATLLISFFIPKRDEGDTKEQDSTFAVIITAYKNFTIVPPAIDSFVRQNYKKEFFTVYAVADDCTDVTSSVNGNVHILVPAAPLSSKVKSIEYAINNMKDKPDYIVIMDADNLAHPEFLSKLNAQTGENIAAVQGRRTYKNLDSVYSCLDAAGEIYYNTVHRAVPAKIGSSAAIAGSAMAVRYDVMEKFIRILSADSAVILAEDKLLQNHLVMHEGKILYAPEAVVYDEKIIKGTQVQRQRTRWLSSYFSNAKAALQLIRAGLFSTDWNKAFFGSMTIYPPIIVLALLTLPLQLVSFFYGVYAWLVLPAGWLIFISGFLLSLVINKAPAKIWKSLFSIPLFVLRQIFALINRKKAKDDFMATEHTKSISVSQLSDRDANEKN